MVNILATHAGVSEATVGDVTAAIAAGADELGELNPLFQGLADLLAPLRREGAPALEFGGVPFHPGARAAYRATGLLR